MEPGSDYHGLVRITGLEPARLLTIEPKSIASANSAISAHDKDYNLVALSLSSEINIGEVDGDVDQGFESPDTT